ncbi:IS607 family transposase (plasmid) [Priestia aryabhattai]
MKVSVGKVAREIGVTIDTIRRWENEGKITSERTEGGHRRYNLNEVLSYVKNKKKPPEKVAVGYARVSTNKERDNLKHQEQVIELYCAAKGYRYKIIEDIGSSMDYEKEGLKELIKMVEHNQVSHLVLTHKDRLLRFGNEIIFEMCRLRGIEIVILNEDKQKLNDKEVVEDVLSVISNFSAQLYGNESQKKQRIVSATKKLFKE